MPAGGQSLDEVEAGEPDRGVAVLVANAGGPALERLIACGGGGGLRIEMNERLLR